MLYYLITLILNAIILWLIIPRWIKERSEAVAEYNKLNYKPYGTEKPNPLQVWEVALLILLAIVPVGNIVVTIGGIITVAKPFFTSPVEDLIKKSSDKQDKS